MGKVVRVGVGGIWYETPEEFVKKAEKDYDTAYKNYPERFTARGGGAIAKKIYVLKRMQEYNENLERLEREREEKERYREFQEREYRKLLDERKKRGKVSMRELIEQRRNTRLYGDIFDMIVKSEGV